MTYKVTVGTISVACDTAEDVLALIRLLREDLLLCKETSAVIAEPDVAAPTRFVSEVDNGTRPSAPIPLTTPSASLSGSRRPFRAGTRSLAITETIIEALSRHEPQTVKTLGIALRDRHVLSRLKYLGLVTIEWRRTGKEMASECWYRLAATDSETGQRVPLVKSGLVVARPKQVVARPRPRQHDDVLRTIHMPARGVIAHELLGHRVYGHK